MRSVQEPAAPTNAAPSSATPCGSSRSPTTSAAAWPAASSSPTPPARPPDSYGPARSRPSPAPASPSPPAASPAPPPEPRLPHPPRPPPLHRAGGDQPPRDRPCGVGSPACLDARPAPSCCYPIQLSIRYGSLSHLPIGSDHFPVRFVRFRWSELIGRRN
jgi:hypothetical protein